MSTLDLRNLIREGNELEAVFDKLPDSGLKFENCRRDILDWLERCVDFGRFLFDPSSDRRALQGRVDYWTSLLGQNGIAVDIDRIAPFDPTAGVPLEIDCPYPGLKAYDEKRQADFIGREKDTEEYVAHLDANPILMIVGGSGSGKSSLALAGILPELKSAHADWQFVPPFTPGAKPFASLGRALAEALENSSDAMTIADSLRQQPERAAVVLSELFGAGKPIMLLIDQFEELLTLCQDEPEQKAFSELLYGLVTPSDDNNMARKSACRILLTLRTDHLARFETSPSLRDLYRLVSNKNIKQLAAMDFASIHQAIETPAKKIGLRFLPPTIIDALASQTASLVDGLPLLQFALQRLWTERPIASSPRKNDNGNKIEEPLPRLDFINEDLFKKLPDVQGALGKVAEDVFRPFDDKKKKLCERLMLELVLLDENFEQPLRRPRSKAELLNILDKQHWQKTTVDEVIDVFVNQGLLHYSGGETQQLEVAHEAMFRNWPTFREWISGEDAKTRLHAVKLIGREALDWRRHENSPGYLKLSAESLKSAQEYVREYWLADKDSIDYINACLLKEQEIEVQRQQAEQAEKFAQNAEAKKRELELQKNLADMERKRAEETEKLNKELQFMLVFTKSKEMQEDNPQYSLLLSIQAMNIAKEIGESHINVATNALYKALTHTGGKGFSGHREAVTCVAISSDNRWLVAGSSDKTALLWDLNNDVAPPTILCGHSSPITAVAISSDNHWLVTGSEDKTALLWDLTSLNMNESRYILSGHGYPIHKIAISPDNHWLVSGEGHISGNSDSKVYLWDLTAKDPSLSPILLNEHGWGGINSIAISSDSRWLVTGSNDRTARRWDLTAAEPNITSKALIGHSDAVSSVAISSNNKWIITGCNSKDTNIRLWDLNNLDAPPRLLKGHCKGINTLNNLDAPPRTLKGHSEGVNTLALSSDNHWLITGSWDNTVCFWNLWELDNLNSPFYVFKAYKEWISGIAISANNDYLIIVSDKTVQFWDLNNLDADPLIMRGHELAITSVAISSDKHWLVTGSHDRTVRLWNVDDPINEPVVLHGGCLPIAISLDYHWLAARCKQKDNNLLLWNLKNPFATPTTLDPYEYKIKSITISPDSHWLLVCTEGEENKIAQLLDLTTLEFGNKVFPLIGHTSGILAVTFSSHSNWLVTGSDDRTSRLWDLTVTDQNINPHSIVLSGHTKSVCAVAFSPNDQWLVTGGEDKLVLLWDLTDLSVPRFTLRGHEHEITAIAISHDNHWLATGSEDNTVRLWDLTAKDPSLSQIVLKGHKWGIRSIAISSDNHWLVSGGADSNVRLWDLTAKDPSLSPILLKGHVWGIRSIAISSDNRWLVTGGDDRTARLWDLTKPSAVSIVFSGHKDAVFTVGIISDIPRLVVASDDTVKVWNLKIEELVDIASRTAGRNMTLEEWKDSGLKQDYCKECQNIHVPYL